MKSQVVFLGLSIVLSVYSTMASDRPYARSGVIYTGLTTNSVNESCKFDLHGRSYIARTERLNGRHYGLIHYTCTGYNGFLISKFEACETCYTICGNNEFIISCQSRVFPLLIGITLGVLGVMVLGGIFWKTHKLYIRRSMRDSRQENLQTYTSVADLLRPNLLTPGQTTLLILTILAVLPLVCGCDRTLYMSSENKICERRICKEVHSVMITMELGMTVCLVNTQGTIQRIEFTSLRDIHNYMPIYYTANFELQSKSMSECKQDGASCWNPETSGTCSNKVNHSPHKDKLLEIQNNGLVHGTTCNVSPLGCNYWCWHKVACTWTLWWLEPILPFAKVYKKEHRLLQAVVTITNGNNLAQRVALSVENPIVNKPLPVSLVSLSTVEIYKEDKLLLLNHNAYLVKGSELNQPVANTLGDYQKQLEGNLSIYPTTEVNCKSLGCVAECTVPSSFIDRFIKTNPKPIFVIQTKSDRLQIVKAAKGTMSLMLETSKLDHLLYMEPACDVKVIFAQGCVGCTQPTPIVIQTPNVRQQGILHFESDCEFETTTVVCQSTPNSINLFGNPKECSLYFRSINKTVKISPDYIFVGNLSSIEVWTSESSSDVADTLSMLWNSENFITGALTSFTVGSIGLVAVNLVMRLLAFLAGRRVAREVTQ